MIAIKKIRIEQASMLFGINNGDDNNNGEDAFTKRNCQFRDLTKSSKVNQIHLLHT